MTMMVANLGYDLNVPPGLQREGSGFVSSGNIFRNGKTNYGFLGDFSQSIRQIYPGITPVQVDIPSPYADYNGGGTSITSGTGGKVMVGLAVVALVGGAAYYIIQRRKSAASTTVVQGARRRRR